MRVYEYCTDKKGHSQAFYRSETSHISAFTELQAKQQSARRNHGIIGAEATKLCSI